MAKLRGRQIGGNIRSVSRFPTPSNPSQGGGNVYDVYANLAGFPVTGESDVFYIADDTKKLYVWDGAVYYETSPGAGGGGDTLVSEGALINSASSKATPVDADMLGLMDSAAANILKKLSWANLKSTLKTYFDSVATTLTEKRITSRSSNEASNATPSVNSDLIDIHEITALAVALTAFTVTGTPTRGQEFIITIKDDGTARVITLGSDFESMGIALPTTTVINVKLTLRFLWNVATSKWTLINISQSASGDATLGTAQTFTAIKSFNVTGDYDDARFGDSLGIAGQVGSPSIMFNAYLDNGTWRYKTNGYAILIATTTSTGTFTIYTSPTGLANDPITWSVGQELSANNNIAFKGLMDLSFASAGQIKFPATANPSADANTLDDYEEGTFDVALLSDGGSITINASQKTMKYTKVGRKVSITGKINVSSVSAPTGNVQITGLPFTNASGDPSGLAVSVWADNLDVSLVGFLQGILLGGGTSIYFQRFDAGSGEFLAPYVLAGSDLSINLTYNV